jgi:hypothetical protein
MKPMKKTFRNILGRFRFQYQPNRPGIKTEAAIMEEWERNGCPVPPPHVVKQRIIKEYQQRHNYSTFIETGTYLGDMVEAQKSSFKKLISIELSNELYLEAKKRFKNDRNVLIVQGDSGKQLPEILKTVNEPAIFWLDGHYSEGKTAKGDKDCPIFEELHAILDQGVYEHVILIDDARLFVGKGDYPRIEALAEYIRGENQNYKLEVKHDIIRFTV